MKSYLKFLSRNKLYTAIEAAGLAISLTFVILIGSYVSQQYDTAHETPDWQRVFVLGSDQYLGLTYWDKEELEMNIPEVESVTHMTIEWAPAVRVGDDLVRLTGMLTDADFLLVPHPKSAKHPDNTNTATSTTMIAITTISSTREKPLLSSLFCSLFTIALLLMRSARIDVLFP